MLIQCTKKLIDQLGTKPELNVEENPLFCWHANLLTLNRKKTVVLTNDVSRYVIVLHGLKAKDFKKFDEVVLQGIRETFKEEGIKDEIIEEFLLQSQNATFTKTKNRTLVARLNKACENVSYFEDLLDADRIYNTRMSNRVNSLLVGDGKNSYLYPEEAMYKELEAFAGEPIFRVKAAQLKVTLRLENHQVWRRIVVPVNRTFDELHKILQETFGWHNSHLHEFYVYANEESSRPIINLVCDEEAFSYPKDIEMKMETGVRLSEYIPTYKKLEYCYDFGDDWQHVIEVEKMIDDYHVNYPVCLDGEGNTPPEDVGGEHGYDAFLEILADQKHPDHKHMVNWGQMQRFENFNIEMVNRMIKRR